MDFITPYCKKRLIKRNVPHPLNQPRGFSRWMYLSSLVLMSAALLVFFLLYFTPSKQQIQSHSLHFSTQLQEALNHGVTLHIDCTLIEKNTFANIPYHQTQPIAAFSLRHHALSNQYIVKTNQSAAPHIFHSIRGASNFMVNQSKLLLDKKKRLNKKDAIRLQLNKYKLPSPLRLQAFLSREWSLSNNWIAWESNK